MNRVDSGSILTIDLGQRHRGSFADKRWHSTVNDRQKSGRTSFVYARIMAYWFHQCQVHDGLRSKTGYLLLNTRCNGFSALALFAFESLFETGTRTSNLLRRQRFNVIRIQQRYINELGVGVEEDKKRNKRPRRKKVTIFLKRCVQVRGIVW